MQLGAKKTTRTYAGKKTTLLHTQNAGNYLSVHVLNRDIIL